MPKFRLTAEHRRRLMKKAEQSLSCPDEAAAEITAYRKLVGVVDLALMHLCPPADLAVLKRHNAAKHAGYIRFYIKSNDWFDVPFGVRSLDYPLAPCSGGFHGPNAVRETRHVSSHLACHGVRLDALPVEMARDLRAAWDVYYAVGLAHDQARDSILTAARRVVERSRTFEALCEAWPQAAAWQADIMGRALPAVVDHGVEARLLASATFAAPAVEAA